MKDFLKGFQRCNLRLLIINSRFCPFRPYSQKKCLALPDNVRHLALPNSLRHLQWHYCPFKCLASSHKQRMEFVHLYLRHSNFGYLWEGVMVILFFFYCVSIILFFFSFFFFFFFNCSYKYKYTPDVFELPPFIYKAVLLN